MNDYFAEETKSLSGAHRIMEYLRITKGTFSKYRRAGLPVSKIEGTLIAHKDELDEWHRTTQDKKQGEIK